MVDTADLDRGEEICAGKGKGAGPAGAPTIFLIGPTFPFRGGISHYTTLLFNQIAREFDVTFHTYKRQYYRFLFPGRDDKDLSKERVMPDCSPMEGANGGVRIKRDLHPLRLVPWIRAGLEARHRRLVLIPWWTVIWAPHYLLFLSIAKHDHNKVLFLCHNVEEHENNRLKSWLSRTVLKRGDGFIIHSEEQEKRLLHLQAEKRPCMVLPHPSYDIFNHSRYSKSSARKELKIAASKKVILFFGFIRRYKGLDYLLKALPEIRQSYPDILLYIVGEVWGGHKHTERINRLIQQLEISQNVRHVDYYVPNEDVELYFKACDFVVLPYVSGTGSGILQVSYGMDKPVVAAKVGAFKEIVVDKKTGFLVPPRDEAALARAIVQMYESDNLEEMEKNVRQYKKRFEWGYAVEKIVSFYEQISGRLEGSADED